MNNPSAIEYYLGWPLLSFIAGFLGILVILFPSFLSSRNQYGSYSCWSWPLLILPEGFRKGGARLLGGLLLCQAMAVALATHSAASHAVAAAEIAEAELFCPSKVIKDPQQRGLYIHRLLAELRKSKPSYQFGLEEPMVLKVQRSAMDTKTYEVDLLSREYHQLGPEVTAARVLSIIEKGNAPAASMWGTGEYVSEEDVAGLLAEANAAWNEKDYDRSLRLARRALEVRRAILGQNHPKVLEIEEMIAAARQQVNSR